MNGKFSAIGSCLNFIVRRDPRIRHLNVRKESFRGPDKAMTRGDFVRPAATAREKGRGSPVLALETIRAAGIRVGEPRFITAARRKKAVACPKCKTRTVLTTDGLVDKLRGYAGERNITRGGIIPARTGMPLSRQRIRAEMKARAGRRVWPRPRCVPITTSLARFCYEADNDSEGPADGLDRSSIGSSRVYLPSTGGEAYPGPGGSASGVLDGL